MCEILQDKLSECLLKPGGTLYEFVKDLEVPEQQRKQMHEIISNHKLEDHCMDISVLSPLKKYIQECDDLEVDIIGHVRFLTDATYYEDTTAIATQHVSELLTGCVTNYNKLQVNIRNLLNVFCEQINELFSRKSMLRTVDVFNYNDNILHEILWIETSIETIENAESIMWYNVNELLEPLGLFD